MAAQVRTNCSSSEFTTLFAERLNNWGWALFFGILLASTGVFALGSLAFASTFTTLVLGWLLLIGGIIQFFSMFFVNENRLWSAALGILYGVIGVIIISSPGLSLATLTLFLGIAWTVGGLIRIFGGLFMSNEETGGGRGWAIAGGIVTFLLGLLVWMGWPQSSLYIVGLFVGIDLLLGGIALSVLAYQLRRLRRLEAM